MGLASACGEAGENRGFGEATNAEGSKPATLRFLLLPLASPAFAPGSGKQKTAPKDRFEQD